MSSKLEQQMQSIALTLIENSLVKPDASVTIDLMNKSVRIGDRLIPQSVCLGGSTAVVKYLLDQDREANTKANFDEPALYGAIDTDEWGKPRIGDWIQTYTGKKFHPLDIRPDDIDIDDIAHALSLVNRFTGHTKVAYSVAEHSVRASWAVDDLFVYGGKDDTSKSPYEFHFLRRKLMFEALMHDASEAYVADLARPIKMMPQMQAYRDMEAIVEKAIRSKYHMPEKMSPLVKRADEIMLRTEARDLMGPLAEGWFFREKALDATIEPWSADLAEYRFNQEYLRLLEMLDLDV